MGKDLARLIRDQEKLDGKPIADRLLAEFAGTTPNAISETSRRSENISFAFEGNDGKARLSLMAKWETGRRFELARLIGDRIFGDQVIGTNEPLLPATRTFSYRQKMQRAFAAELLSPFGPADEMLGGDHSEERQNEVAEHFMVSPMTIQNQLRNNGRISHDQAPEIVSWRAVSQSLK